MAEHSPDEHSNVAQRWFKVRRHNVPKGVELTGNLVQIDPHPAYGLQELAVQCGHSFRRLDSGATAQQGLAGVFDDAQSDRIGPLFDERKFPIGQGNIDLMVALLGDPRSGHQGNPRAERSVLRSKASFEEGRRTEHFG
jgi:hypothetical protein